MLSLDVSPMSFRWRLHRREALTAGLAAWSALRPTFSSEAARGRDTEPQRFAAAKRCLLLFLTGGPPQHDTWDPKPKAPTEIRGELAPMATAAEGIFLSELFPLLARQACHFRILRSLTHGDSVHATAGYALLTGERHRIANRAVNGQAPPTPQDRPNLASTVAYFHRHNRDRLPPIALPEIIKDAAVNEVPGQGGGFLGSRFDPLLVEADTARTGFLPPSLVLPVDVSRRRLTERRALRQRLEQWRFDLSTLPVGGEVDASFEQSFSLLRSESLHAAFDWETEPISVQEAYGNHLFGRGTLLARRLLEAGAPFVTVYWHYEGPDDSPVWDTHWNNFRHLRQRLAPPADQAISAVLVDLHERGLLDETLVICVGEFGRSPRINAMAGRDHWPHVFSALIAGAGIPGGTVLGASDREGAYPVSQPISVEDFATTTLHLLGVPADYELHDQLGRPSRAGTGQVRPEIFS